MTTNIPTVGTRCACGHALFTHARATVDKPCADCGCAQFRPGLPMPPLVDELEEAAGALLELIRDPEPFIAAAKEAADAAPRIARQLSRANTESRRLVLMVELEQLNEADLLELSDFLNGLLGSRCLAEPADVVVDAVSVRAAYAFGDWPPVLEAVN